jgi:hypothetical protein
MVARDLTFQSQQRAIPCVILKKCSEILVFRSAYLAVPKHDRRSHLSLIGSRLLSPSLREL